MYFDIDNLHDTIHNFSQLNFSLSFDFDRFFNLNACMVVGYNYNYVLQHSAIKEIEMSYMPKLELSYRPRILSLSNLTSYFEDV